MSSSANITNIQALVDLRPALIRFGENAQVALRSTGSDASKLLGWLERERLPHWKREVRIRSEVAVRANTELIQQTSGDQPRPSVDARKAYELAKRRVHEAEEKYQRTRYWIRAVEKEVVRYRAAVQPMAGLARAHMTEAVARVDSYIGALDAYTSLAAPSDTVADLGQPESDEAGSKAGEE